MFFFRRKKIRYAVVGLGHIAQAAVLPAFEHASKNSVLAALVSNDPTKQKELGQKYRVPAFSYDEYSSLLMSGAIDAVYIAVPNHLHREYSVLAAKAGIHVLCEKPMAIWEQECQAMMDAARANRVKLMIAYRLHFEEANLNALKITQSGKLGNAKIFNSVFSLQVKRDNIRTKASLGGGPLHDIGIYCINAARHIFQAEPYEVFASGVRSQDSRFSEVDETVSCILKFPEDRLATFTVSFGATDTSFYEIIGAKGRLRVDPAYEYVGNLNHYLTVNGGKEKKRVFKQKDQFAPEILYFSNCIIKNKEPEPSGEEGLTDVRIMNALSYSAETKKSVCLQNFPQVERPSIKQVIKRAPVKKPELVHAESASGGP